MSWPVVPFTDVLEDVTGGNEKTKQSDYAVAGTYPIVDQGQSLIGGYTNDTNCLCKTDVPVIIFGDHTKALKYVDFPFCLGADGTKVLKPKQNADTKFLFYALHNIHIPEAGYSRHFKYLKAGKIPLPPLEEQKRIAGILDQADALRRLRNRALDKLNTLGQAIFHEMFGDPISNERGWPASKIGEASIEVSDGNYAEKYPKSSDFIEAGVPFVRANNIKNGTLVANDLRYISDEKHELLQKGHLRTGDVLITTRGKIGNLAVVPKQFNDANINAQLVLLRCLDETIQPEFLYFQLSQQSFQLRFERIQTGVALKQLPVKRLKQLEIIVPPVKLQNRFTEKMQFILKQRQKEEDGTRVSSSLFASLQHRAFRGEL